MQILLWPQLDSTEKTAALLRPDIRSSEVEAAVEKIIAAVINEGDAALRRFNLEFDQVEIEALAVGAEQIHAAASECEADLLDAIDSAISRIREFHNAGMVQGIKVETAKGLVCESRYLPISPAGLYIPGGTAPLISTVLMLAIPAGLAGCDKVILCTPPSADGSSNPAVLAAADRCGISSIFRLGGAQAIAAMAFGTESVPKCVKLFGPGNAWVTEAKRQVASTPDGAAQDMPAGPSEVLVIADKSAGPVALCWDLLAQAEHGPDSQTILISDTLELLQTVEDRIFKMAADLPRAEILSRSLRSLRLIKVDKIDEAVDISNRYAPEHLIINCRDAAGYSERITTAGSVFVGAWTPESLGDYCSGTNHVLPTYGYARAYGGLSVVDFMRRMTLQSASPEGLQTAGPVASKLAAAEGLEAHRMAVEYRLNSMEAS